jgi:hypothetical protein
MKIRASLAIDSVSAQIEIEMTDAQVDQCVAHGSTHQTIATALMADALKTAAQRVRIDLSARAATAPKSP